MEMGDVRFDANGLVPAVVQNFFTGEVLTVAYMNAESLAITLDEKSTCFWSRSRGELWRKGETSGNTQQVVKIMADCDKDALVVQVIPKGPACHTGETSCFFETLFSETGYQTLALGALYRLIEGRKNTLQEGSYTSYLFQKGKEKILKKVGEECTEVVVAAMKSDKAETIFEVADLCYHVLVLMAEMDITPLEVQKELAARHVVDHKVKQETMQ